MSNEEPLKSETFERGMKRLEEHLFKQDEMISSLLKGHLILEEQLDLIITNFVFHADYLQQAQLRFYQKVYVARSLSLDEEDNPMWGLILAINTLRNDLSHSLESDKRQKRIDAVRAAFIATSPKDPTSKESMSDLDLITDMIAYCLGFLAGFEEEVSRFRAFVDALDRSVNPHRHSPDRNRQSDTGA